MSMHAFWKQPLLTAAIAGSVSLFVAGNCPANGFGGDLPCDCLPCESAGCDGVCHTKHPPLGAGLSQGLRQFHQRMKAICNLSWCHDKLFGDRDTPCDDACDAALMGDLMMPAPEVIYPTYPHAEPASPMFEDGRAKPEQIETPHGDQGKLAPPVHVQERMTDEELFKSLPDPFQDDSAQLPTVRSVQPSSHSVDLQPAPRPSVSRSHESSRRRANRLR